VDAEQQLRSLYAAFNARDVDRMLGEMGDDVDWPNAWEGGRLHGRQSVRDYWTRQWSQIDPSLEVIQITARPDGRVVVEVRQLVRSVGGETLSDGRCDTSTRCATGW
jgi:ketosteroid isomerase-like protein